MLNIIEAVSFELFLNNLKETYERLIFTLNNQKTNYLTKIICLKIFTAIAIKLKLIADIIIGFYQEEIIFSLQNATKDRVHKVQVAANIALKEWMQLEEIFKDLERKKTSYNRNYIFDIYFINFS
jgi:hypothetical protein